MFWLTSSHHFREYLLIGRAKLSLKAVLVQHKQRFRFQVLVQGQTAFRVWWSSVDDGTSATSSAPDIKWIKRRMRNKTLVKLSHQSITSSSKWQLFNTGQVHSWHYAREAGAISLLWNSVSSKVPLWREAQFEELDQSLWRDPTGTIFSRSVCVRVTWHDPVFPQKYDLSVPFFVW